MFAGFFGKGSEKFVNLGMSGTDLLVLFGSRPRVRFGY
jgi:hypothetical protein